LGSPVRAKLVQYKIEDPKALANGLTKP
jgi:hypothetical protein